MILLGFAIILDQREGPMRRALGLAAIAAFVLPLAARAQSKPDFTGTWTVDPAKSDPVPAGRGAASGTLTIKQTGQEVLFVNEGRQGPQLLMYRLDGSESTNQVVGRGGTTPLKSKAKWDGSSLVVETTRELNGISIATKEVRRLSNAGKEMEVETTIQTPQGEQKRKTIFTKDIQFADPCKVNPTLPICGHH
jgi:hypothetical protein